MKWLFVIGTTAVLSIFTNLLLRNTNIVFSLEKIESYDFSFDTAKVNIRPNENVYKITDTLDLKGETWYLPCGSTIEVEGGIISNGVVSGNHTKLVYTGVVFDNVRIIGSWNVPVINTSMFATLAYDNSLKDVFSLTSPKVYNTVYIAPGVYYVTAGYNFDRCLRINSNTEVTIDGNIVLTPNSYPEYSEILIEGEHIILKGKGTITGDKFSHIGSKGEWGMGVHISNSLDVIVKDLSIKDCWGDCIYIGGKSRNIFVENCYLDNGRRQGVSVVSASDVHICNCIITNVGGTAPQYAIDIEPNTGDTVENVFLNDIRIISCQGGIMGCGIASDASVGQIDVKNCWIEGTKLCPVYFEKGRKVVIKDCKITNCETVFMIVCNEVKDVHIANNTIFLRDSWKKHDRMISVNYNAQKIIENNIIL